MLVSDATAPNAWAGISPTSSDGSRHVVADIDLGAKLSFLLWLAIGLLVVGAFVLAGSTALIILAARPRRPPVPPAPATASSGAGSTPASEPADRPDREPPPG